MWEFQTDIYLRQEISVMQLRVNAIKMLKIKTFDSRTNNKILLENKLNEQAGVKLCQAQESLS